ncbi:MAG: hypothetical protein LBS74_07205 [Oscillospiraceae bacterium]|jgi:hypothetical protein|nr:hypothetical protein [Oscillospiraceae bacterium]
MSRYIIDIPTNLTQEQAFQLVGTYLSSQGFNYTERKGERVWQNGEGWLVAPQFIRVDYQGGFIRLQAWIATALLPGVFVGEHGLTGFWGWGMKLALKNKVEGLIYQLAQAGAAVQAQQAQQAAQPVIMGAAVDLPQYNVAPVMPAPPAATRYAAVTAPDIVKDQNKALVISICSLLPLVIPLLNFILPALGLIFSAKSLKIKTNVKAGIGLSLSILTAVLAVVITILWAVATVLLIVD